MTAHAQPADPRAQAGAAFQRAVAAEKRQDWRTAIAEYETAYRLSPHPDVLYNIGAVYEQLGELRRAVDHYQRYLDGNPGADDRRDVETKISTLRARPATVRVVSDPSGARVSVDGTPRGVTPLATKLEAGVHKVTIESDRGTAQREVVIAYGEDREVAVALVAGTGWLTVTSNAPSATVTLDGQRVGTTPWSGAVEAGHHVVVLTADGFTTTERAVEVPSDGSAQITGAMGRPVGWVEPTPPARGGARLVFDSGGYLGHGYLATLSYGFRTASHRLDGSAGFGFGTGGITWALRLRGYLLTGPVRPYVVGALNYGFAGESSAFAGGGLLFSFGRPGTVKLEYFIESGYGGGKTVDESFRFVPIIAGVVVGRS